MGMFDWAAGVKIDCPICNEEVDGFQSKDGECVLDRINFREVNNFYAICDRCETWIEYNYDGPPHGLRHLFDYTMTYRDVGRKT